MEIFIGIDLGTSGCRAIAIDSLTKVRAKASHPLPQSYSQRPGYQQQEPHLWWSAVIAVLRELTLQCPSGSVSAIAVDGTSSTVMLTDRRGEPITPALMYHDTRARSALADLQQIAPPESPVLSASSSLAKLLHLQKTVSDERFYALHQADWILGRLCGQYPLSDENNALKMGYDPVNRCWPEWISTLGIAMENLPRVSPCGSLVGRLTQEAAKSSGLPQGISVIAGTTDSNAAFIATGANQTADAVTSLGSTLVLKVLAEQPIFDAQFGIYSHRLEDRWLVGGASNSGGAVLRQYFSDEVMHQLTQNLLPEQPTGLNYYPLIGSGERFPINDPDLPSRLTPRPNDDVRFFQAMLEGIAHIEHQGYQLLAELGAPTPKRVFSMGGGALNEPWRRMRQQRLQIPILLAEQQEAAYGTAYLALKGFSQERLLMD
jgi:sugar (pentulose or hexulose) kinase